MSCVYIKIHIYTHTHIEYMKIYVWRICSFFYYFFSADPDEDYMKPIWAYKGIFDSFIIIFLTCYYIYPFFLYGTEYVVVVECRHINVHKVEA